MIIRFLKWLFGSTASADVSTMDIVFEVLRGDSPNVPEDGGKWRSGDIVGVREVGRLWADQYWTSGNPVPVTITRVPGIATVSHSSHGKNNGDLVIIEGADQERYNGPKRIYNVTANTYDFDLEIGTPQATGNITSDTSDDPCATDLSSLECHIPNKFFCVVTGFPVRPIKRIRTVFTEEYTIDGDSTNDDPNNKLGRREWFLNIADFVAPIRNQINKPPYSTVRTWEQIKANATGRRRLRTITDNDTV